MIRQNDKLQGLQMARAVAALAIAYDHSWHVTMPFPVGTSHWLPWMEKFPAVEFFFAISGFVICMITERPGFRPWQFLVRRVFRIYPLWILTSLCFLMLALRVLGIPERGSSAFIIYSFTLLPTEGYPFYDVGWSLQHEIGFYALATVLVPKAGMLGLFAFLFGGAVLDHIFTLPWYLHQYTSHYSDFLAGIVAFALRDRFKRLGFWGPVLLGIGLLVFVSRVAQPAALFLLLIGFINVRAGTSIFRRAIVLLGDASYSLYLIHPLIFYLVYARLQPPLPPIWSQEFLRFGSIAVICLISIASWKLFETPMIRMGEAITRRRNITAGKTSGLGSAAIISSDTAITSPVDRPTPV